MSDRLRGLVVLIVIAAIYGAVGKALAGGIRGGLAASLALGFIGALLGPWVARQRSRPEPFVLHVTGQSLPIVSCRRRALRGAASSHLRTEMGQGLSLLVQRALVRRGLMCTMRHRPGDSLGKLRPTHAL
jgi:uncharacterized membrane protein YeaQ/YmgE (transglycosylase-associated protein family)